MQVDALPFSPPGRYFRYIPDGNFSLQANTEETPAPNRFFVFEAGRIVLETDDFPAADREYRRLSREYWEARLSSGDPLVRLASAWGVLGQDVAHREAAQVVRVDGTDADRKRLHRMALRSSAERRAAASGRPLRPGFYR